MKKILFSLLAATSLYSYADSIYIEPHYTIALESANIESSTNMIQAKTLTPLVYKKYILPAGVNVSIQCKDNQAILRQVDQYTMKEKISIGNGNKVQIACDLNTMPDMMWSPDDEDKVKSDNVKEIDNKAFSVVPFNSNNIGEGKVTGITTDGNLTNVTVNKSRYFDSPQFFATINGKMYFVQSTNNDDTFTVHAAHMQKLLVTDKNGQLLASIDFPSYE